MHSPNYGHELLDQAYGFRVSQAQSAMYMDFDGLQILPHGSHEQVVSSQESTTTLNSGQTHQGNFPLQEHVPPVPMPTSLLSVPLPATESPSMPSTSRVVYRCTRKDCEETFNRRCDLKYVLPSYGVVLFEANRSIACITRNTIDPTGARTLHVGKPLAVPRTELGIS
jgi:hypothetical protein